MNPEEQQNYKEVTVLGVLHNGIMYYMFTFSKNRKSYGGGLGAASMYASKSKLLIQHVHTHNELLERLFNDRSVPIEHLFSP